MRLKGMRLSGQRQTECGLTECGQTECGLKDAAQGNAAYRNAAQRNGFGPDTIKKITNTPNKSQTQCSVLTWVFAQIGLYSVLSNSKLTYRIHGTTIKREEPRYIIHCICQEPTSTMCIHLTFYQWCGTLGDRHIKQNPVGGKVFTKHL